MQSSGSGFHIGLATSPSMQSSYLRFLVLAILTSGSLAAQSATATSRSGAGNMNSAHICIPPRVGQGWFPFVAGGPGSAVGMVGHSGMANVPFMNQTILVDLASPLIYQPYPVFTGTNPGIAFGGVIPNDPGLIGLQFSTQAFIVRSGPAGVVFFLTNACDMVVGT